MTQLYVLLFLLLVSPIVLEGEACPIGWIKNTMNSKCYKFFSTKKSWNEAKAACGQQQAKLVELKDFNSNDFIRTNYVGIKAWIGSYRCGKDTCFLNNNYVPYTPYAPDEPHMSSDQPSTTQNSTDLKEDNFAILIRPDGRWADEYEHNKYPYICEMTASSQLCIDANWTASFDTAGLSACPSDRFIVGLRRSKAPSAMTDYINHIEGAKCCKGTSDYENQDSYCLFANWSQTFSRYTSWNMCPMGYFLSGLKRSGGQYLSNIEQGYCCKPQNSPIAHKDCFTENIWDNFNHDHEGTMSCGRPGYFITEIYKSVCEYLYCIEEFKCCSMK